MQAYRGGTWARRIVGEEKNKEVSRYNTVHREIENSGRLHLWLYFPCFPLRVRLKAPKYFHFCAWKIPFSSRFLQSVHTVKMPRDDGISGAFIFSSQMFLRRFIAVCLVDLH